VRELKPRGSEVGRMEEEVADVPGADVSGEPGSVKTATVYDQLSSM
jgi:hypothetical protein